jgi:NADPH:quinone reductase-like Zn-dependent oxidoreductase
MPRAIQFDHYGDVDVLHVAEVPEPSPAGGEVEVRVAVAGTNPGEIPIRTGALESIYPTTFPCGEVSDFAGVVANVGPEVTSFLVGDDVIGWSDKRSAQADYVVVPEDHLIVKRAELPWEVAGGLFVVAATSTACIRAVAPKPHETVVVSGAAGGVGGLAAQLATLSGATVIGIASDAHADWLASIGVTPVAYGDGMRERINVAAPDGVDAFIDTYGSGYVDAAIDLGVSPDRINTIIDFRAAQRHGAHTDGMSTASTADVLAHVANLVADGDMTLPIDATFPLDEVRDAYTELAKRHTRGKIVLTVSPT